jgi:hypothetical protein
MSVRLDVGNYVELESDADRKTRLQKCSDRTLKCGIGMIGVGAMLMLGGLFSGIDNPRSQAIAWTGIGTMLGGFVTFASSKHCSQS